MFLSKLLSGPLLPQGGLSYKNPFTNTPGNGVAYEDQGTFARPIVPTSTKSGIVAYSDSLTVLYVIGGEGQKLPLTLQLTSGQ